MVTVIALIAAARPALLSGACLLDTQPRPATGRRRSLTVTLTDASMHIGAFLAGCSIGAAVIRALILARRRSQASASDPYAGFRARAYVAEQLLLLMDCEGHCDGATAHEVEGDDATCVLCGTARQIPAPDPA